MEDRYLNISESVKRLVSDYKKHRNLIVAFDFDSTVFDYFELGDIYPKIESLLIFLKKNNFTLILFTGSEGDKLKDAIEYCNNRGYAPDYVNCSPIESHTKKPYYNILLDDRAGLNDSYQTLITTLNILNYDYRN